MFGRSSVDSNAKFMIESHTEELCMQHIQLKTHVLCIMWKTIIVIDFSSLQCVFRRGLVLEAWFMDSVSHKTSVGLSAAAAGS